MLGGVTVPKSRVKWTRDEVILALDLFFSSHKKVFPVDSPEVIKLSKLLNELPIIPREDKTDDFRNTSGIHFQLSQFDSYLKGRVLKVGKIFVQVYEEYIHDLSELHKIASAIRNSKNILNTIPFGDKVEGLGFKEGALLFHLHRYFEADYKLRLLGKFIKDNCTICKLDFTQAYHGSKDDFYELHLIKPPKDYTDDYSYSCSDYIVVCPSCHKVLHITRPWVDKINIEKILV